MQSWSGVPPQGQPINPDQLLGETLEDESDENGDLIHDDQPATLNHKYVFWLVIRANQMRKESAISQAPLDQKSWEDENKAVAKFGTVSQLSFIINRQKNSGKSTPS